jgi:hypothetical protein
MLNSSALCIANISIVVGWMVLDPDQWVHFTSLPKCDQSVSKLCDAARKSANTAFGGVAVSLDSLHEVF